MARPRKTALEGENTAPSWPPPPRKRGRPHARDIDRAAAALASKSSLPQPPGKTISWDQMQEYLALLTPEMWTHVVIYVYRLKPRIIRQLRDKSLPNYIDCTGEGFNLEYMISRHGGGVYQAKVNDKSLDRNLFNCTFEINMVEYEPKLNYEELDITHRENMSYIQLLQHRGILDNNGQPMPPATQTNGAAGANTEVVKELLGFFKTLTADQQAQLQAKVSSASSFNEAIGQILIEKMRQDDPNKPVELIMGVIDKLAGPGRQSEVTTLYDRLITMQAEYNKTILGLIQSMNDGKEKREESSAFADQLEQLFGFAEKLQTMRGAGRGAERSAWDIGLDYARELGRPLIATLGGLFGNRGATAPIPGQSGATVTPGTPPAGTPAFFDPYANPELMRQASRGLNGAPAPPANGETPAAAPPAGAPAGSMLGMFSQYAPIIVNALNNGTPGYDFADYVVGLLGNATHAMIAGAGEAPIVETMLSIPEMALFGESRLRQFVHEFVAFREYLQPEPEPAGAAAAA